MPFKTTPFTPGLKSGAPWLGTVVVQEDASTLPFDVQLSDGRKAWFKKSDLLELPPEKCPMCGSTRQHLTTDCTTKEG